MVFLPLGTINCPISHRKTPLRLDSGIRIAGGKI
jgi:hypothetical protein